MAMFGFHDDDEAPDSGSMFCRVREGSWAITSVSDPRWNDSGRGVVGGGVKPAVVDKAIEAKKALYGAPPADLEWSYMKD